MSSFELKSSHKRAVEWLVDSNIRASDGAYYSYYKPATREYENWSGNQTCLLSTAGAVLALDSLGYGDLALHSAEHICGLAIKSSDELRGGLLAGRGSRFIFANWTATAIVALLQVYQRTRGDKFLRVAFDAGKFLSERMQNRDGSINQHIYLSAGSDRLRRMLRPRPIWLANSVEAFLQLYRITGDECFISSAYRFINWLIQQQRPDGSFPMVQHSLMSRLSAGLLQGSFAEMLDGCRKGHPASHSQSIKALMLVGKVPEARLSAHWLAQQLSPNGLLHQFYFRDGTHSVEEDVMPTAHFGLLLLEYPELGATKELLRRIASGIFYAQICSRDRNADGGIRGLPGHPTFGKYAYCWDTLYSIFFLHKLFEREHAGDAAANADTAEGSRPPVSRLLG
jgi:hypothetical protein